MKKAIFTWLVLFSCLLIGCSRTPEPPADGSAPTAATTAPTPAQTTVHIESTTVESRGSTVGSTTIPQATSSAERSKASGTTTRKVQTQTTAQTKETVKADTYTYGRMTLTLPEGFTVNDSGTVPMAFPDDYPARTDNIAFTKAGADSIGNYTQQTLEEAYRTLVGAFVRSINFETIRIDGLDTIKYAYEISVSGSTQLQTQYIIFGDTFSYILTFTHVSGDFDDAFQKTVESIRIR